MNFGFSKIFRFLERILIEHVETIYSLESKLFFISLSSIRTHSRKYGIFEKPLQHISNLYINLKHFDQSVLSVQKENKWIILNFVIRKSVWPLICGEENESFFDFSTKCFSKVAQGIDLNESGDRILRVEGRDAGLGIKG